jgi:hypothetical protein
MTLNDQMTVDICRKMRDDVDGAIQRNFEVGTAVGIPAAALLIVVNRRKVRDCQNDG